MAAVASCGENKFKLCFIFFLQSSVLISRTHMLHCRPVLSTSSQQVDRGNALIVGKARLVKVRHGRLNLKDVPQRHVRKGGCLLSDAALSTHRAERRRSAGARLLVCSSAATRVAAFLQTVARSRLASSCVRRERNNFPQLPLLSLYCCLSRSLY